MLPAERHDQRHPAGRVDRSPAHELSAAQGEQQRLRKLKALKPGDVLLFEEVIGPKTGDSADADPTHRHAVRLTKVEPTVDSLDNTPVVEIEWSPEDALPFPLCLSAVTDAEHGCVYREDISVAHGNVVLVDHGKMIDAPEDSPKDRWMAPTAYTQAACDCAGHPSDVTQIAGRFQPQLAQSPLTFSQPADFTQPASQTLQQDPRKALPQLTLHSLPGDDQWTPRFDLLGSGRDDRDFVVEIDNEGRTNLRFGDGECGRAPEAGMQFSAWYRTGNGNAGNVGGEAIYHLVYRRQKPDGIDGVRNPLPAGGGTDPEPLGEVKLFAPSAFRKQLQRAITPDDYARLAKNGHNAKVQRAAATLCWTGSWYEAQAAIDPVGSEALSDPLRQEIERDLYRFRRIGYDLRIIPARYVSLNIALDVCVQPDYLRGHVKAALLRLFSNRILPNGKPGFFHPDNFTFGDGIYLSQLVAAAQVVEGVESVRVIRLQRQFERPKPRAGKRCVAARPAGSGALRQRPGFSGKRPVRTSGGGWQMRTQRTDTMASAGNTCGCCEGTQAVTPQPTANRPGLEALSYRVGTHAAFSGDDESPVVQPGIGVPTTDLDQDGRPKTRRIYPLRDLTTRDPGDSSVALLDAWATVAEVLTFYQERIANEGYLRTATERRSVLELARLIGYALRPGVAASAYAGAGAGQGL